MTVARTVVRHWLSIALVLGGVFVALPVAAPILAMRGDTRAAGWIYAAYQLTCHQLPQRSNFVGGRQATYSYEEIRQALGLASGADPMALIHQPIRDPELGYQVAFCQRELAMYSGLEAAALVYAAGRRRRRFPRPLRWQLYLAAALPIVIDGGTQLFGWRESTPSLRYASGGLFGVATAFLVLPALDAGFVELAEEPVPVAG